MRGLKRQDLVKQNKKWNRRGVHAQIEGDHIEFMGDTSQVRQSRHNRLKEQPHRPLLRLLNFVTFYIFDEWFFYDSRD